MTPLAKYLTLSPKATFRSVIQKLNKTRFGTLLVTESSGKLCGIITDRDVRKAVLAGKPLNTSAARIMNGAFTACLTGESKKRIRTKLKNLTRLQMPVVDKTGKLKDIVLLHEFIFGKNVFRQKILS